MHHHQTILRLARRQPPQWLTTSPLRRHLCSSSSSTPQPLVARSLRDVARATGSASTAVHELLLSSSQDLICKNMMCEHLGSSCACKLSLVLERLPELQTMDLSNNALRFLPESAFQLTQLTRLDLSRNALTELSPRVAELQELQVLDLSHNRLTHLPADALLALPKLRKVRVGGNPVALEASALPAALREKLIMTPEAADPQA